MSGLKTYSETLKHKVVSEVLSGQLSIEEARRRYHITGHCTVLKWIRKFEKQESPPAPPAPRLSDSDDEG
ncbi:transposase [Sunxiuqinia indica]|uniref:transposase n=1 Tax=Sunxiuqinia indica TaxID=2692584 RepID=UPI00135927C0|nr:transposase [Sunxiuqinia indica]